jgi:Doubled CXXCH motif (Paired_CXXCH_1)
MSAAWLLLGSAAGPVSAGAYHTGDTAICGDCHTKGKRLSHQDANEVCLSCHGRAPTNAPGVLEANPSGVVRQAGALNGMGGMLPAHVGHTLGGPDRAPGGAWAPSAGGMTCTDCHAAHGEAGQYRNLLLRPGAAESDRRITYASGPSNDPTKDVWLRPSPTMAGRYAAENVHFNQPDLRLSAYAAWCQGCHARFHGAPGTPNMGGMAGGENGNAWVRHPTVGVAVGARGDRHSSFARYASLGNRVQTLSPSASWPALDNAVSCMSCHKAHGNRNPFGLLYMSGRGQLTEEGDTGGGKYINLCQQCHQQGLS